MATQNYLFVQNENLPIHRGKGVDGTKADVLRPAKTGLQDRKALRDLSKVGKPLAFGASKVSSLKEKPPVSGHRNSESTLKSSHLTNEEIKRCHEWAKEGVEQAHFTGNDNQKLEKENIDERVRKKVAKVMSSLRQWTDISYDFRVPHQGVSSNFEDTWEMEFVPEVLPPMREFTSRTDIEKDDNLLLDNILDHFPYFDFTLDLKLKENDDNGLCIQASSL